VAALQAIAQAGRSARSSGQSVEPTLLAALRTRPAGEATERAAAAGALLALGEDSGRAGVEEALRAGDAKAQLIAVEAAAADARLRPALLPRLVEDKAAPLPLRARAAEALAEQGDRRGAAVLHEATRAGGADGLRARTALDRLGEANEGGAPAAARQLLDASDVEARRAAVVAVGKMPAPQAVPLLMRAAHDPAPAVRGQAGEAAAELPGEAGQSPPGVAVLRALLGDSDASVRARAASLLARLLRALAPGDAATGRATAESRARPGPRAPVAEAGHAIATTGTQPQNEPGKPPGESGEPRARRASLLIEAPAGTEFQIDKQPSQRATGRPIAVAAGAHRISHAGGVEEVTVSEGATATVRLVASQVALLLKSGTEALERKDYKRARKALEKASTLCGRRGEERATCASLAFELSYSLGRVYEAQEAWAEAMTEYDKILQPGFAGKLRPEGRAQVSAAKERLASRLGRLRVSKPVKGRCQTVELWMPPGRHRVNVGGGQFVQVRARETTEVSGCP
jgi:tetratricopeptide (TPR) repeat protein